MNADLVELIDKLAQNSNATSERIWEVLLQQAAINAVTYSLMLITLLLCFRFVLSCVRCKVRVTGDQTIVLLIWSVMGVATIITLLFVFVLVPAIATAIMNPEYWALQQILKN